MSEKNINKRKERTASKEVDVKEKWPGWPGHNAFRILVPEQTVGALIGDRGEFIKKAYQETKAQIKVFDHRVGTSERTVLISAKEEPDVSNPPAIKGLLKVYRQIIDASSNNKICSSLLVPFKQALDLIGKHGATVKTIQDSSNCEIKVDPKGDRSVFALTDDYIVYIQGKPANVHKAIKLIARHLRKFLVDQGVIEIFEKEMKMPDGSDGTISREHLSVGSPEAANTLPPKSKWKRKWARENKSETMKMPDGSDGTISSKDPAVGSAQAANTEPPKSIVTTVTRKVQIPVAYADAIVDPSDIGLIQSHSGATVIVQEERVVPYEITIELSGLLSQVDTAHMLIQGFIMKQQVDMGLI